MEQYYYREGQLKTSISSAPEVNIKVHRQGRVIGGIFLETFSFSKLGFDDNNTVKNFKLFKVECRLILYFFFP